MYVSCVSGAHIHAQATYFGEQSNILFTVVRVNMGDCVCTIVSKVVNNDSFTRCSRHCLLWTTLNQFKVHAKCYLIDVILSTNAMIPLHIDNLHVLSMRCKYGHYLILLIHNFATGKIV